MSKFQDALFVNHADAKKVYEEIKAKGYSVSCLGRHKWYGDLGETFKARHNIEWFWHFCYWRSL